MVPDALVDLGWFLLALAGLYLLATLPRRLVERFSGDDVTYEDGVARRRSRPAVDPDDRAEVAPDEPVPEGAVRCPTCGTVNEGVHGRTFCYECNRELPTE